MKVTHIEASKSLPHIEVLLTAATFGLLEKVYTRGPEAFIASNQVYEVQYD